MLTIRKLLPGEQRDYNSAHTYEPGSSGSVIVRNRKKDWLVTVLADGTIIEAADPCSVRFADGSRSALIAALEKITDAERVRQARSIARRALRDIK